MIDSNQTLRWNRTAREAYGHDVTFNNNNNNEPSTGVIVVISLVFGFIIGLIVGV